MTRFNASSDEMAAVSRYLREHGVYTMVSNNSIHTNPPLCISEDELAQGFDVIDGALSIADQAVQG
jgi:taurine---2-oxoglutarate transaminase